MSVAPLVSKSASRNQAISKMVGSSFNEPHSKHFNWADKNILREDMEVTSKVHYLTTKLSYQFLAAMLRHSTFLSTKERSRAC